jgi:nicotinate-nucleotide pyrophosphorylase (carboxylating)
MSNEQLREAVQIRGKKQIILEASGGVNLDTVAAIAATGVDQISVGALTHSARAIDLSMEIVPA